MPTHRIPTPPHLRVRMVEVARDFRKTPTASEALLWQALRGGRLGAKFRRQHPIGPFIVDFYCAEANLVVEVDGPVHETQREHDIARQELLELCGYRILRVPADDVECRLNTVLTTVGAALTQSIESSAAGA